MFFISKRLQTSSQSIIINSRLIMNLQGEHWESLKSTKDKANFPSSIFLSSCNACDVHNIGQVQQHGQTYLARPVHKRELTILKRLFIKISLNTKRFFSLLSFLVFCLGEKKFCCSNFWTKEEDHTRHKDV